MRDAWSATLAQTFQEGYREADAIGGARRAGSYSLIDLQTQYSGMRKVTLTLGVHNLFDRDPPLTTQNQAFQVGYDPTYADPRGRFIYASIAYSFR
jgi:iron complex outermembrane receptor protein